MVQTDFTIADVLEWARTKPADETYDFVHADVCALGQFAREKRGYSQTEAACGEYEEFVPDAMMKAANGSIWNGGHTFGGLVRRLEKLRPETPVTKSDWARLDAYMADIELAVS